MAAATTTRARRLLALALGGALALNVLARPAGADEAAEAASAALIERIAAAHRTIASIQGRATMRTHHRDEPASEARVKQVQFALLFPDHYRLVFNDPGDDEGRLIYLSDGVHCEQREYQFKDEAPTSRVTPVGADEAEITRLLACFRLDMAALSADFAVTAVGTEAGPRVTLTPRHPPLAEQLVQITVALDAAFAITRFSWTDPQGNIRDVAIEQSAYDQPIPPATFQVTPAARSPGK
jgi:outer membrane lipoprotein-sorting protein